MICVIGEFGQIWWWEASVVDGAHAVEEFFDVLAGEGGELDQFETLLEAGGLEADAEGVEEVMEAIDLFVIDHDGRNVVAENQWPIDHGTLGPPDGT
jgi:hypothetical protein